MQKLFAIKDAIDAAMLVNPERLYHSAEEGEADFSGSEAGPDLLLFRHTYTGVIELEGASGSLEDVLAQVLVWLAENGSENDALESWSGVPVDRHQADIELRIRLEEEVHYVPADPGYAGKDLITWDGRQWKRGTQAADTATTLDPAGGGITVSTP